MFTLQQTMQQKEINHFELRTGETVSGRVRWWDLGAFGLEPEGGGPLTVIQRHAVVDWPMNEQ